MNSSLFAQDVSRLRFFASRLPNMRAPGESSRLTSIRVNAKDAIGGDRITQFGRALMDLNIDIICANSPQAKGRIERAFGTLQDRMVKELRLAGMSTVAAANAWLPGFIAGYNARSGGNRRTPRTCTGR